MIYTKRLIRITLCIVLLMLLAESSGLAQMPRVQLVQQSDIIFVATVKEMEKTSFSGVPASSRTLVAEVDAVLDKPPALPLVAGDHVTIEVRDPSLFRAGMQATFYARGWIIGEGLAVREVEHEQASQPLTVAAASEVRQDVERVRRDLSDAQLKARIQDADMVVAGRVLSIQNATLQPSGARPARITEHNPDWREAVVAVDTPIKGAQANERLLVRFPASIDVQWFNAPKFSVGQQGIFILKRDTVSGAPKALLAGAEVQPYTALGAQDVLPLAETERVLRLIKR